MHERIGSSGRNPELTGPGTLPRSVQAAEDSVAAIVVTTAVANSRSLFNAGTALDSAPASAASAYPHGRPSRHPTNATLAAPAASPDTATATVPAPDSVTDITDSVADITSGSVAVSDDVELQGLVAVLKQRGLRVQLPEAADKQCASGEVDLVVSADVVIVGSGAGALY